MSATISVINMSVGAKLILSAGSSALTSVVAAAAIRQSYTVIPPICVNKWFRPPTLTYVLTPPVLVCVSYPAWSIKKLQDKTTAWRATNLMQ